MTNAQRSPDESDHGRSDEASVWTLIVVLLGLSCLSIFLLLHKVGAM
jgi:hypothetical protein